MSVKQLLPWLTIIAFLCGGTFWVHSYFATNESVAAVQQDLDTYKAVQAYEKALAELFFWRKQAREHPDDPVVMQNLIKIQAHVDYLKKRLGL